jgi:FAD/FMN-containing dehydrogenase
MTTFDTQLGSGSVEELKRALAGDVIVPGDPEYETARRVWNGAIDRRPALIARCASVPDVVEAVRFARSERLPTAVRGGAHNVAGHGTCDDGIVIDLSPLRDIEIDPVARTARVQGGALWADVDAAAQAHGLATPGGMISSTGVAGLTLGGGIGHLSRKHGLTCDNLLAAELVTADGTVVTASETEHPDLFWALRGGGGNFGIVTEFTFRLHPVGLVLGGMLMIALEDAAAFLRGFRELALPDELGVVFNFITVPPAPDFPQHLHGYRVLVAGLCFAGDLEAGERAIAPIKALAPLLLERVAPMPYTVRQVLQDASAPAGMGNYWKSGYLTGLEDELIERVVTRARATPNALTQLHLYVLGGAAGRVDPNATAYGHRAAPYLFSIVTLRADPEEDAAPQVDWARAFWAELEPFAAGAYVNFAGEDGTVRDAYPGHYERLAAVKAAWDPTNLFRLNHNIEPAR